MTDEALAKHYSGQNPGTAIAAGLVTSPGGLHLGVMFRPRILKLMCQILNGSNPLRAQYKPTRRSRAKTTYHPDHVLHCV